MEEGGEASFRGGAPVPSKLEWKIKEKVQRRFPNAESAANHVRFPNHARREGSVPFCDIAVTSSLHFSCYGCLTLLWKLSSCRLFSLSGSYRAMQTRVGKR